MEVKVLIIDREIRREHDNPVVLLTAKGEDTDRIVGLELGADEYLPEPFNPREVLGRMKAISRRSLSGEVDRGGRKGDMLIRADGIVLDKAEQAAFVEGNEVELSTTE